MDWEKKEAALVTAQLVEALETCVAELVTLHARLPAPYAKNVRGAIDQGRAALHAYRAHKEHRA